MENKYFKEFMIEDVDNLEEFNNSIMHQLAMNMARAMDLDLSKTPLVDLITAYIEHRVLKQRIDNAIKYVSKLSSKGRDCEIYEDIKQDILKVLKGE